MSEFASRVRSCTLLRLRISESPQRILRLSRLHPSHSSSVLEIAGRAPELLLELAGERRARHVAELRQLRQRPGARRLVEQRGDRRRQAGMTRQREETTRRTVGADHIRLRDRSRQAFRRLVAESGSEDAKTPGQPSDYFRRVTEEGGKHVLEAAHDPNQ